MKLETEILLTRREIEEAVETFKTLKKEGFFNLPKITWWLLHYKELYSFSYQNRHYGSCFKGMGCPCSWDTPESRFSDFYSALQEVVDLHEYEKYFQEEMKVFHQLKDDYPALMQWLKKNDTLGADDFILFWIEWYEEEEDIVRPFVMNWQNLEVKFKASEWHHTVSFLKVFNELYWTSDACPPLNSH